MKALTLVEMIIVIAIFAIVVVVAVPVTSRLQISSQLNESAWLLTENLRLASHDSYAGYLDNSYGIKLFTDSYVVYQGVDYDSRVSSLDRLIVLPSNVSLEWSLSGLDEIVYNRRGRPQVSGSINLKHDSGDMKSMTINRIGVINQ